MFSKRTSWDFSLNPLSRLLTRKREAGEDVLDLTESNPTRAGLDYPEDEILAAISDRNILRYEPTPHGLTTAREAIAHYYAEREKTVSSSDLLLTSSTSEAYAFLFKTLMDPGDRILLPRPSYPLFDDIARLEALGIDHYRLVHDGSWSLNMESVEQAITPRTKAVLAVHPGNPTGSYLKLGERERLVEICCRHQIALVVDEVFLDYPIDARRNRAGTLVGEQRALTFVMSGLSKVAGLPQMKLSWIWMGGPMELKDEARSRLEHVSDAFLSVGTPVQRGLEHYLALSRHIQSSITTRITSNYRFLLEVTTGSPVTMLGTEGGWYTVLRLPAIRGSDEWALELIREKDLIVHPGYLYDFATEPFLVISLLPEESVFRRGVHGLLAYVDTASRKGPHDTVRGD
jgi:hypothetical protein